jgi:phage terminase small subunit
MAGKAPKLNTRQQAFVEAYTLKPNATQAAISAGYSPKSARQQGTLLRAYPAVIEALQARRRQTLARLEVTEDMVLAELAAVAFSNLDDFLEWSADAGGLVVKPSAVIPRHLLAALESIEDQTLTSRNKDGTREYERHKQKVKLYPKLPALQLLAEYLGLTDSMAPKVTVYLKTGINREPLPAVNVTPEAEPLAEPVDLEPSPSTVHPGA